MSQIVAIIFLVFWILSTILSHRKDNSFGLIFSITWGFITAMATFTLVFTGGFIAMTALGFGP